MIFTPQSAAQRRATSKYNKEHYTNISCRVSLPEAAAIRAACAILNTTASTVARAALLNTVTAAGLTLDQFKHNREAEE